MAENKGTIKHDKNFITENLKEWFTNLEKEIPFQEMLWGNNRKLPRLVYRYDDYGSGRLCGIEVLAAMIMEKYSDFVIDGVWTNLYRNSKDYTPYHQDNYGAHIFTLSFGSTRMCYIKSIKTKEITKYTLKSGDLFYFDTVFDSQNLHCIPSGKDDEPRISIVFFAHKK